MPARAIGAVVHAACRAEDLKTGLAVVTNVLVERHLTFDAKSVRRGSQSGDGALESDSVEYTIRRATPADFDDILSLWSAASYNTSVPDGPDTVRQFYDFSPDLMLIAESGGRAIGVVIAPWNGWRGYIGRLAVDAPHRRAGVASALIAEAERRLRAKGARQVYANVDAASPIAVAFWEARGFRKYSTTGVYARNTTPPA